MTDKIMQPRKAEPFTFLGYAYGDNLDNIKADIAIMGVPYGRPYSQVELVNDQAKAPDAIRKITKFDEIDYTTTHHDFDLGGPLLDNRDVKIVDFGNVYADILDPKAHYENAEKAARKIFASGATLITLGGDHGVTIPIINALEVLDTEITLIHIDAHIDWRKDINGEPNGYSSPIRRASEKSYIKDIFQIGIRAIGSARTPEVEDALAYGAKIITAYDLHEKGVESIIDAIPSDKPIYLTIDADGIDPTIMPAVISPTPGGLNWIQLRKFIHLLVNKCRVVGMDLVEIAPSYDVGDITMVHAERLLCNFIGATVRADYYE